MMQKNKRFFIDVDHLTESGGGSSAPGSIFLSNVPADKTRVVSVLAKGEGTGIRAGVPASLTATMALRLAENDIGMEQIAERILHSPEKTFIQGLHSPSFTVLETNSNGHVDILEFGHPPVHLYRGGEDVPLERVPNALFNDLKKTVYRSSIECMSGDRIMVFTGSITDRFGGLRNFNGVIKSILWGNPFLSSRELIHTIYQSSLEVVSFSRSRSLQDPCFTLASLYLRIPRRLLVATGAPFEKDKDPVLAGMIESFDGAKAVCGGTTASIIGRELNRPVDLDTAGAPGRVPPLMKIEGIDLVTEGTLTLGRTVRILERGVDTGFKPVDAAEQLAALILNSDIIQFIVGTRINEQHQDPNLPEELDIRRNVIRRIAAVLRSMYLKEVDFEFM